MSEIPYYFEHPVPIDFRNLGWFKNHKTLAFVTWAFSRCSKNERKITHDCKLIILKPYQFIFGRKACVEETGLTEDEVRTQQKTMEKAGYLKKAPNKTPNRFTIYEWVTEAFSKIDPQQNPQQTPNRPPTDPHNTDIKNTDNKEDVVVVSRAREGSDMKYFTIQKTLDGKEITCRQDEYYAYLARTKQNPSVSEVESAWKILEQNTIPLANWMAYLDGIIKKTAIINHTKNEPKLCKTNNLKKKSEPLNGEYLAKDTKESPLARYEREMKSKTKF